MSCTVRRNHYLVVSLLIALIVTVAIVAVLFVVVVNVMETVNISAIMMAVMVIRGPHRGVCDAFFLFLLKRFYIIYLSIDQILPG